MKILFVVNFARTYSSGSEIFIGLWGRWLRRFKDKVDCDVKFIGTGGGTGFDPTLWGGLTQHCDQSVLDMGTSQYGGWLNYPSIVDAVGYDFVFRMDHDAFITVECLNKFCAYIRSNPHIDFFSPSNNVRPVMIGHASTGLNPQAMKIVQARHPKNSNCACYTPWNQVGYNGDIYGIKRSFFMQALENYKNDPRCAFHQNLQSDKMTFGECCELLGHEDLAISPKMKACRVFWDGAFGTDIWTHMCALNMVSAGVADNNNKSFQYKNRLRHFDVAKKYDSWDKVEDETNILWPRDNNLIGATDLFHVENGYTVNWQFEPEITMTNNPGMITTVNQLQKPRAGDWGTVLYCMTKLLTKHAGLTDLQIQFETGMQYLVNTYNIDAVELEKIEEEIAEFYLPALVEYI